MLRILSDQNQIDQSRTSLRNLGCDTSRGWRRWLFKTLYRLRFRTPAPAVAFNKSWDILTLLETIQRYCPEPASQIFDMGSYNSEAPLALWSAKYRNIRAADFNPLGRSINWYGNRIQFKCENFYEPDIKPNSLDVITAVSVIEHGYDQKRLIQTINRLLKKGGIAILTTDYHQEKIRIAEDYRLFGLPYQIFSQQEIQSLLSDAVLAGLKPLGDLQWTPSQYPISFLGNQMTFLLLALKKE
ncbi:MAG: methyltransferase domain-containing protein [Bdellovibrionota bacterium]